MLILKTIGFFFLALIASVPFNVVLHIFLGSGLGGSFQGYLNLIFVGGITLYPLYEHFFIRKRRDSYNENERIKAYYQFFKTYKYTQSVRGIILFFLSFILSIIATIIFAVLAQGAPGNEVLGIFLVSLIIMNFLFRQYIFFGLPEELSATGEDNILINETDYNKIEDFIITFNRKRRYYLSALVIVMIAATCLLAFTGMDMIIYFLVFFFALVGVAHLNMSLKREAERHIFPQLSDTQNLEHREKFKLTTAMLRQRDKYMNAHTDRPSVIHPERLDFHFNERQLEHMYYETNLNIDLDDGRQCRMWELKLPKTVLLISIELKKHFDTPLFLTTKRRRDIGYPEIPNNTFQFGDIFYIYGEDSVLAYSVMDPLLQENFLKLIGNVNAFDLVAQVHDNEMLITLTCGSDIFELGSLFRPITMARFNRLITEIRLIRNLPQII